MWLHHAPMLIHACALTQACALHVPMHAQHVRIFLRLLFRGSHPRETINTCLALLCKSGQQEAALSMAQALLRKAGEEVLKCPAAATALKQAGEQGWVDLVRLLLQEAFTPEGLQQLAATGAAAEASAQGTHGLGCKPCAVDLVHLLDLEPEAVAAAVTLGARPRVRSLLKAVGAGVPPSCSSLRRRDIRPGGAPGMQAHDVAARLAARRQQQHEEEEHGHEAGKGGRTGRAAARRGTAKACNLAAWYPLLLPGFEAEVSLLAQQPQQQLVLQSPRVVPGGVVPRATVVVPAAANTNAASSSANDGSTSSGWPHASREGISFGHLRVAAEAMQASPEMCQKLAAALLELADPQPQDLLLAALLGSQLRDWKDAGANAASDTLKNAWRVITQRSKEYADAVAAASAEAEDPAIAPVVPASALTPSPVEDLRAGMEKAKQRALCPEDLQRLLEYVGTRAPKALARCMDLPLCPPQPLNVPLWVGGYSAECSDDSRPHTNGGLLMVLVTVGLGDPDACKGYMGLRTGPPAHAAHFASVATTMHLPSPSCTQTATGPRPSCCAHPSGCVRQRSPYLTGPSCLCLWH